MGPIAAEIEQIGQLRDQKADKSQVPNSCSAITFFNFSFPSLRCGAVTPVPLTSIYEEKRIVHNLAIQIICQVSHYYSYRIMHPALGWYTEDFPREL